MYIRTYIMALCLFDVITNYYDAFHKCMCLLYIYYTYVGVQPKEICLDVMNGPSPTHTRILTLIYCTYVLLCIGDIMYNMFPTPL